MEKKDAGPFVPRRQAPLEAAEPITVSVRLGARLTDWIMSSPQIQEEPVMMGADRFCLHWRGVKDDQSVMINSVRRGALLSNSDLRREFLSLRHVARP